MKKIITLFVLSLWVWIVPVTNAQTEIVGHWEGVITQEGKDWRIWLDIDRQKDSLKGTIDVPDYGLHALPLTKIQVADNEITIERTDRSGNVVFNGIVENENIKGQFKGLGVAAEFQLKRTRAQPVTFVEEEVRFQNGEANLVGTLVKPQKTGKYPAIVFTHGSGNQTRTEDFYRSRAYLLARNGIAALIYDRRGKGDSTGGGDNIKQVQLNSAITAASVEGLVAEGGMDLGIFKRIGDTDIWYYTLILPDELRTTYRLNVTTNAEKKTISDPLNSNIYAPNSPWTESVLTLPKAPPQPWRDHKAVGKWQDIEINSKPLGGKSTINVYLPKSWNQSNAKNWNVFIGMDAIGYQEPLVPTDRIIEYLMDRGKIPPTIVILTVDLSGIGDQSEKGYEPVANFLADEVIPTVREKFGVAAKPSQVIVWGKSRRGMMST